MDGVVNIDEVFRLIKEELKIEKGLSKSVSDCLSSFRCVGSSLLVCRARHVLSNTVTLQYVYLVQQHNFSLLPFQMKSNAYLGQLLACSAVVQSDRFYSVG